MSETVMAGLVWHCESCGRPLVEKRLRTGRYHVLTGHPVVERWLVCPRDRWWSLSIHSRVLWGTAHLLSKSRRFNPGVIQE